MNIVVSSNENYIKPLKIMLLLLFKYNKECNIFYCIQMLRVKV